MIFEPRPWQPDMLSHLAEHQRCRVFGRMGSGKTVVTLSTVAAAKLLDEDPVLVLAPLPVAQNTWPNEIAKWPHLKGLEISPVIGTPAQRKAALQRGADIYTCNYDNIVWLKDYCAAAWPFRTVVADEDTRLKNFRLQGGGPRAAALATVAHTKVERWIGLTGTPASKGYQDLWGPTWFADGGERLGRSYTAFEQRWFRHTPGGYGLELMPYSQAEIDHKLKDICRTIDPKDYGLDLAEPIDCRIEVELPHKVRAMYRQMEKHFFMEVMGHEIEAANAGVKSGKLLQLASGAVYTGTPEEGSPWEEVHTAKIEALKSIIEEAMGAPILVAYNFISDLARLKKAFPKAVHLDNKKSTEDRWNRGEIDLLIAHPSSAGHGRNLQDGGNIVVYFSHGWDAETREQIMERIGPLRQFQSGYNRPVYRYFIVAKDTADEAVMLRHAAKLSVQDALLEAMTRRG